MASTDRPPSRHLTYLTEARDAIARSGLFPVVRGAEARAPDLPRVGKSRRPAQNIVDLAQLPSLSFAQSTLDRVITKNGRIRLLGRWLGLTGPMGPLPSYLTEFAGYERRYSRTQPFGEFLDLIAGRMLQLFYRAWGDSQAAAQADRPADDRFATYVAKLSGAGEGVDPRSAFPAHARVYFASLFSSPRSASAIEDSLSVLLGLVVRIEEYRPRMRALERSDCSRLGLAYATLGGDIVLGGRVSTAEDAFRVCVCAAGLREYEQLLPTGHLFQLAAEAVTAFAPSHLEWELAIEVDDAVVPPLRLDGRGRLGWTSWLAPDGSAGVRSDAHLRKTSLPKRPATMHSRRGIS